MGGIRVLIVGKNGRQRGGESVLAFRYFRVLRAKGIDVWMVLRSIHSETAALVGPENMDRIYVIDKNSMIPRLHRWAKAVRIPAIKSLLNNIIELFIQYQQRIKARQLVSELHLTVVHQPTPVSPIRPSLIYNVGAPVVVGPLNGNIHYPPPFCSVPQRLNIVFRSIGEGLASLLHWVFPGKLNATILLVANKRTAKALPRHIRHRAIELVENGVVANEWGSGPRRRNQDEPIRLVFVGRLVKLKGADMLIEAVSRAKVSVDVRLKIVGDGEARSELERLARTHGVDDDVEFLGWLSQTGVQSALWQSDALVLPSIKECGGAVVLEAMAAARAAIVVRWGGPGDYVDESCGILVEPLGRDHVVEGITEAINRLYRDPLLCEELGRNAKKRVIAKYTWDAKVDRMIDIYRSATEDPR